jgi:hypothetical protein
MSCSSSAFKHSIERTFKRKKGEEIKRERKKARKKERKINWYDSIRI